MKPSRKRQLVDDLQVRYGVSQRQTCGVLMISRSSYGYRSVARDSSALAMRIRDITSTRVHYGYRRVHVQLQREGWQDNHKRVYRLYREQGLSLRHKRPSRNKAAKNRQPVQEAHFPNHGWGMNFVSSRKERIEHAKAEWKAQEFPKVPGDEVEYIPLPE